MLVGQGQVPRLFPWCLAPNSPLPESWLVPLKHKAGAERPMASDLYGTLGKRAEPSVSLGRSAPFILEISTPTPCEAGATKLKGARQREWCTLHGCIVVGHQQQHIGRRVTACRSGFCALKNFPDVARRFTVRKHCTNYV